MKQLSDIWYDWLNFSSANLLLGLMLISCFVGLFLLILYDRNKFSDRNEFLSNNISTIKKSVYILVYALICSLVLINPLSAFLAGMGKTVFYDYSTLWMAVPIIPICALFLVLITKYYGTLKKSSRYFALLLTFAALLLCGSLGTSSNGDTWFFINWRGNVNPVTTHNEFYDDVIPVLDVIGDKETTILAPPNVTEYAHYYSGRIKTLYGKDMWDGPATAFVYEQYSEDVQNLYNWMLYISEYGCVYYYSPEYKDVIVDDFDYSCLDYEGMDNSENYYGGVRFVRLAKDLGVDTIIFFVRGNTDINGIYHIAEKLSLSYEYIPLEGKDGEGYIVMNL